MTEDQKADLLRASLFATQARDIRVSFEFFPPATDKMEEVLWNSIRLLEPLQPEMVSVTYGAGGSTRERTHATVSRILKETSLTPAAHLTCVAASREEVDDILRQYWDEGVRHIVALRGDMPKVGDPFSAHPGGYKNAAELVTGARRIGDFDISVAAYPEFHPESGSPEADIDNLKRKIDAGASRAITQYFFDVEHYFRFLDRVLAAGITVPIVPGILPVTNFETAKKFSRASGIHVPDWLHNLFEGLEERPECRQHVAAMVAMEQCMLLYKGGVKQFHIYTLNRAELTLALCHVLGVRPRKDLNAGETK